MSPTKRRRSNEGSAAGSHSRSSHPSKRRRQSEESERSGTFGRYYNCNKSDQEEIDRTLIVKGRPPNCDAQQFMIKLIAAARLRKIVPSESIPIISCSEVLKSNDKVAIEANSIESVYDLLDLDGQSIDGGPPLMVVRHSGAKAKLPQTFTLYVGGLGETSGGSVGENRLCSFLERNARKVGLIDRAGSPFLKATILRREAKRKYAFIGVRSRPEMLRLLHLNQISFDGSKLVVQESVRDGKSAANNLRWNEFVREWRAGQEDDEESDIESQSKSPSADSRMGSTLSENPSRRGIPRTVEASVNSSHQDREEEIKCLKEEIQQLLDRIDSKNEELKASRKECTRSREEFKKLEVIESKQRDELRQQRREADEYRDKYDRLNGILQRKVEDLEDAERNVAQLRDDIRRLEREKSRDREDLIKEAKAADEFEADYKGLKKQYDADVDRLEGHVRRLERRCKNIQDDLNRQKEIADDYKQKYESGSSSNAAGQVEHETATNAINDEVAKLREENLRLERLRWEEVATQRKRADNYQKMYHKASSECVESDEQYRKLRGDLFETKRSLNNAEDALDEEREKRREAEARVKQLEEELSKAVKQEHSKT